MKTLKVLLQDVVSGLKAWVDTNTVHKSGNETIDGTKTFSAPQCYSSNAILFNSSVLPTQGQVPSANINPLRQYIGYGTSYANSVFIHDTEMRANGRNHYRWTVYSDDHSANAAMWLVYNPDSEYLRYLNLKGSCAPDANNTYHLGTPDYKWKTLNGVNPGALSLPSSSYADIDTKNWDLTGATSQSYTPAVHGWLFVSIQNIAGNYLSIVGGRGAVSIDGTGVQAGLRAMLPVIANESVAITVKTGSIFAARFYPMLGNV